ncbi:MAG: hypothetical protein FOGNACKC_05201 [Anaerolineae bacterium]|nr:hypothetical protein [Anaerolineae bacterium]
MATTNLPRVSPPTQHVSEKQLIIFALIDMFDSIDRLKKTVDRCIAQMNDTEAIISGQMIEGEVMRRDY